MNAIELLLTRTSCSKLTTPAPSNDEMGEVVQAALRAPDHASLSPYKFLVYQGEDSLKQLGELMLQAKLQLDPNLSDELQEKTRNLPLRAPMVVVAVATHIEHPKVPFVEQIVTTGCALHSMLFALQTKGFNGYWRTGGLAQNDHLKQSLGFTQADEIVGFLYVGTPMIKSFKPNNKDPLDYIEYR
ncbi:MAG: nitroreductase family protein [Kangiellaceae bacterium]|jgi:nitroreductase|nr:nitroreductase family protein [Kangiellaceae bacterium]